MFLTFFFSLAVKLSLSPSIHLFSCSPPALREMLVQKKKTKRDETQNESTKKERRARERQREVDFFFFNFHFSITKKRKRKLFRQVLYIFTPLLPPCLPPRRVVEELGIDAVGGELACVCSKMGGQRREECEREKDKRKGSRGRRRREQKKLKTQNLLLAYLDVSHHGPADEHVLHRCQLFVCLFVFFGILLSSVSKCGTRERRREEGKEGERKNLPAGAARARRR